LYYKLNINGIDILCQCRYLFCYENKNNKFVEDIPIILILSSK